MFSSGSWWSSPPLVRSEAHPPIPAAPLPLPAAALGAERLALSLQGPCMSDPLIPSALRCPLLIVFRPSELQIFLV